jgi:hypothetical protein
MARFLSHDSPAAFTRRALSCLRAFSPRLRDHMHRRGNDVTSFFDNFPAAKIRLSFAAACLAGTALVSPALAQNAGGALPPIEVTSPTTVPTPVNQIASSINAALLWMLSRQSRGLTSCKVVALEIRPPSSCAAQTQTILRF